jgi:Tfp pilus assembly protein PilF
MELMKRIGFSLLALILLCTPAYAAEQPKKGAGGPLDKFTGLGRKQDFDKAIPEERHAWEAMRNKQPKVAVDHFKAAIAAYPNVPRAFLGMGIAYERLNELDKAQAAYRDAIKCDTSAWAPWKRLGNLLYQQEKFAEAREAFGNALALHPPQQAAAQLETMIQAVEAAKRNGHADVVGRPDTGEDPDN